jgi:phage head maturation protease
MTKRKLIYKPDSDSAELRTLDVSEVRAASDGTAQVLEGYAATFNSQSSLINGQFIEVLLP